MINSRRGLLAKIRRQGLEVKRVGSLLPRLSIELVVQEEAQHRIGNLREMLIY